jgi:hypothetical protein
LASPQTSSSPPLLSHSGAETLEGAVVLGPLLPITPNLEKSFYSIMEFRMQVDRYESLSPGLAPGPLKLFRHFFAKPMLPNPEQRRSALR